MVKLNCRETINHPPERSCYSTMIPYKQLSLADFFTDCQNKFDHDKYEFLSLLDQTIDLDEIVPVSFVSHFHSVTGRPRKHLLYPMPRALLLQLIFSIPTISLLIVFFKYSQELRDFCGFDVVPDASIRLSNRCTLMDISATLTSSVSLLTDLALSETSPFTTKTFG